MKKFNINNYIYIQITEKGFKHLENTVGAQYIKHCIKPYKVIINNEAWYKLQGHEVFDLLPIKFAGDLLYYTNVMFDDADIKDVHVWTEDEIDEYLNSI